MTDAPPRVTPPSEQQVIRVRTTVGSLPGAVVGATVVAPRVTPPSVEGAARELCGCQTCKWVFEASGRIPGWRCRAETIAATITKQVDANLREVKAGIRRGKLYDSQERGQIQRLIDSHIKGEK